ncbi:P-loop containing nucleoside triphosphate hydrolase protein [Amanita muscaria]
MVVAETENAKSILIAVMGPTGSGKTSFVNVASGSSLVVGGGLQSCTSQIQVSSPFLLNGRLVTLIDTPGFDDTQRSDSEILNSIASHLASTYQAGKKLSGILYFHRISDFRMGGISTKNVRMFRELCGDSSLKNVVIVTNMWGEVAHQLGEEREAELASQDFFFKPVLAKGARMMRHNNMHQSAKDILQSVMENVPEALKIQKEIVDEGKAASQTAAAAEAERELREQQERHRQEMLRIQREREEAIRAQEEKARREREAEEARIRAEIAEAQRRREEAERQMREEQARQEQRMREEREAAERRAVEEAAERERQAAEAHFRILQAQAEAERERWRLQEEMRRVEEERRQAQAHHDRHRNDCIIA